MKNLPNSQAGHQRRKEADDGHDQAVLFDLGDRLGTGGQADRGDEYGQAEITQMLGVSSPIKLLAWST